MVPCIINYVSLGYIKICNFMFMVPCIINYVSLEYIKILILCLWFRVL